MLEHFYDIESLSNVFTVCNFKPEQDLVDCYVLADDTAMCHSLVTPRFQTDLRRRVLERNSNFRGQVRVIDLSHRDGCADLARTFGLSDAYMVNNPKARSSYPDEFRPVCDTDEGYDPDKHPFLFGYNSMAYDTTMLAQFFSVVFRPNVKNAKVPQNDFIKPLASNMRAFNDSLFSDRFKSNMPQALAVDDATGQLDFGNPRWAIRKNMLRCGRNLDVARLNEKQSKVGLKRLLGMRGYQILESDKLKPGTDRIEDIDQLLDLIAYNVSDCVNLRELFHQPYYQGQFSLKQGLLETYPELRYKQKAGTYEPDVSMYTVRPDRLTIDSTSAKFATMALCPYGHLKDIETVSFVYPSDQKCEELRAQGKTVRQVNVLEESRKFFERHFSQYPDAMAAFDKVYRYYKSIEGKNFNESTNYAEDHGQRDDSDPNARPVLPERLAPQSLADIPKDENCMFYYNADGTPSSCFVTFSTGGIHGAEYNKALFEAQHAEWESQMDLLQKAKSVYPDPLDLRTARFVEIDGEAHPWKEFLKGNVSIKKMRTMTAQERDQTCWRDIAAAEPRIFVKKDDGSTKLNDKYVFTSAVLTNHEDFTSYYPNMLRMMSAFWNPGLGKDRYGEIFEDKERYGKLMKDKSLSQEERDFYSVKRNGTKLILNSASGAADTHNSKPASPIQMNNRIISMRIIGQLFTWRIGQAQTLQGATIPSTNTDGLYSVMEATKNNAILAKESADIGVEIEPEPTYLISKDTNNRLEMEPDTGEIISASGGSLACRKDTDPTKALAHSAIIDWALAEYLVVSALNYRGLAMDKPFDREIGRSILSSAEDKFEPAHLLRMYQNVLASSPGSVNYIFALADGHMDAPIILQHYNRVFLVKKGTPGAMHLCAANAKVVTAAQVAKRRRNNERMQQHDPMAMYVLNANGVKPSDIPRNKEAVIKNVPNLSREWYAIIENSSLMDMSDARRREILDAIDQDKYLVLFEQAYEMNWRNSLPSAEAGEPAVNDEDADAITAHKSVQTIDSDPSSDVKSEETADAESPSNYNVILSDAEGCVLAEGAVDEKTANLIKDAIIDEDEEPNTNEKENQTHDQD